MRCRLNYDDGYSAAIDANVDANNSHPNYGDGNYGDGNYGGDITLPDSRATGVKFHSTSVSLGDQLRVLPTSDTGDVRGAFELCRAFASLAA